MADVPARLVALERRMGRCDQQIDDIRYHLSLLVHGNAEFNALLNAGVGTVAAEGSIVTGMRNEMDNWIWIESSASAIGPAAFKEKQQIVDVVFSPNAVLSAIGNESFMGCRGIKACRLPASLTEIGGHGFFRSGVERVSFEAGSVLESIGDSAFGETPLREIVVPPSVVRMGGGAFMMCRQLERVLFGGYSSLPTLPGGAFASCDALRSIFIPASVKEIQAACFGGCVALENVRFGGDLTIIRRGAFSGCVRLRRVELPASLRVIGERASQLGRSKQCGVFQGCATLEEVVLAPGSVLAKIGPKCFLGCTKLARWGPAAKVRWIGAEAFAGCASLVSFPPMASLEQIAEHALSDCTALTRLDLPPTVKVIGAGAFRNCTALATVAFNGRLEVLGEEAFRGCTALTNMRWPNLPKRFSGDAFPIPCELTLGSGCAAGEANRLLYGGASPASPARP